MNLPAISPNDVHEYEFVDPCYLERLVKFHSLKALYVVTRRCGIEPLVSKSELVTAVWNIGNRLGLPRFAQVDNEMTFYGSPLHPHAMGRFVRRC